jgi:hypothetical protein
MVAILNMPTITAVQHGVLFPEHLAIIVEEIGLTSIAYRVPTN